LTAVLRLCISQLVSPRTAWIARSRCAVRAVIGSAARKKPLGCCQAAGIAKGRPLEKLVKPGIFVRLDRGRQMLVRRSGIRGGFAAKKYPAATRQTAATQLAIKSLFQKSTE